ncbi:methylglyoxal reductase (NADPH-dependent) gre2 [Ceratobasidium sp. 414]|nr:methylglyoxal reductase (NADPH-dependent) gre2 [Ceratobasidium sp. 414]
MPSIEAPAKILVTGSNGYFAGHAVKDLLECGYTVVGTVRSANKGDELAKLFAEYGDRFSYAVVPNITKVWVQNTVVKHAGKTSMQYTSQQPSTNWSVRAILMVWHTLRPPQWLYALSNCVLVLDYFPPAIDGTTNIIKSVKKFGPTVKRVVLTSSCVAVFYYQKGTQHTENETILKLVEERGSSASAGELYQASKTLAEKAAWQYVAENKDSIKYDLVAVLPSYIIGANFERFKAPIHAVTSKDQLVSASMVEGSIRQPRPAEELNDTAFNFIHVKDIAAHHSAAFTQPDAAGHRIIGVAADAGWQDIYDALNEEPAFPEVPKGNPGSSNRLDSGSKEWDTSSSRKLLGREFIGTKQAFRETEEFYQKKGWAFMP